MSTETSIPCKTTTLDRMYGYVQEEYGKEFADKFIGRFPPGTTTIPFNIALKTIEDIFGGMGAEGLDVPDSQGLSVPSLDKLKTNYN